MYSVAQTTQQKQEQNLKAPRQQRRIWFAHLPCSGHTCLRKGLYLPTVLTDTCPVSAMPPCGTSDPGKGGKWAVPGDWALSYPDVAGNFSFSEQVGCCLVIHLLTSFSQLSFWKNRAPVSSCAALDSVTSMFLELSKIFLLLLWGFQKMHFDHIRPLLPTPAILTSPHLMSLPTKIWVRPSPHLVHFHCLNTLGNGGCPVVWQIYQRSYH